MASEAKPNKTYMIWVTTEYNIDAPTYEDALGALDAMRIEDAAGFSIENVEVYDANGNEVTDE